MTHLGLRTVSCAVRPRDTRRFPTLDTVGAHFRRTRCAKKGIGTCKLTLNLRRLHLPPHGFHLYSNFHCKCEMVEFDSRIVAKISNISFSQF